MKSSQILQNEDDYDLLISMDEKERIRGAIWGQLIGDALALGTHWIYSAEKMKQEYPEVKGFEMPKPGHYHAGKTSGESTHYGEGCRLMLQSVAENKKFDAADFSKRFRDFFGSTSYTGYIDRATRGTLENMQRNAFPTGADDDQMATATRLAPLVALYYKSPEFEQKVLEATILGQNLPKTIAYMQANARILRSLLLGQSVKECFENERDTPIVGDRVRMAIEHQGLSLEEAKKKFGLACYLDETFPFSVYLVLKFEASFEKTLLANTAAGGDNAGRGGMIGAWLGATQGFSAIPPSWISKIKDKERIDSWIDSLLID